MQRISWIRIQRNVIQGIVIAFQLHAWWLTGKNVKMSVYRFCEIVVAVMSKYLHNVGRNISTVQRLTGWETRKVAGSYVEQFDDYQNGICVSKWCPLKEEETTAAAEAVEPVYNCHQKRNENFRPISTEMKNAVRQPLKGPKRRLDQADNAYEKLTVKIH